MADIVSIDELENAIVDTVRQYTEDVEKAIEKETKQTADAVLEDVKSLAPKRTEEYADSFVKTKKTLKSGVTYTVWNKKHYRRVHLLEFGHAKVNGGRVEARPHMAPALDKHAPGYEQRIKKILEDGG